MNKYMRNDMQAFSYNTTHVGLKLKVLFGKISFWSKVYTSTCMIIVTEDR